VKLPDSAASTDEPITPARGSRGLRAIRHFYRMRIELDHEPSEPQWPEGMTLRTATPDDAKTVYEAHQESFEDHWEYSRMPFEEWQHWLMREGFDPTLWFVLENGTEVAAVELCREHEGEPGLGWVSVLGVRKQWRRRDLGALLLHRVPRVPPSLSMPPRSRRCGEPHGRESTLRERGMRVWQSDVHEKAL
jgi:GNAT superfamily N-acetyltransferase